MVMGCIDFLYLPIGMLSLLLKCHSPVYTLFLFTACDSVGEQLNLAEPCSLMLMLMWIRFEIVNGDSAAPIYQCRRRNRHYSCNEIVKMMFAIGFYVLCAQQMCSPSRSFAVRHCSLLHPHSSLNISAFAFSRLRPLHLPITQHPCLNYVFVNAVIYYWNWR